MKAIGERGAGNPPATFDEGRQGSSYRLLYPVIKRWKRRKSTRTHIHASGFKRSLKDNRIRFNSNNERQKRLLLLFQELCCLTLTRSGKNSKLRGLINLSARRLVGSLGTRECGARAAEDLISSSCRCGDPCNIRMCHILQNSPPFSNIKGSQLGSRVRVC